MKDDVVVQLRTGDYLAGRRDTIKEVLEILDRYYLFHYEKSIGEYVTVGKEIEEKIAALKGGEQVKGDQE